MHCKLSAEHIIRVSGLPRQLFLGAKAQLPAGGRDPLREHLGQPRTFPGCVLGASELVGQVLHTADGRAFRITGLDVLLPDTAGTYAITRQYGAPPDATRVAPRPLPPPRRAAPAPPRPWDRPQAPPTAVIRPAGPKYYPGPFDHQRYIGDPIDQTDKHWNGAADILEGHGLTHASKNKISNAFYRGGRRLNTLAGRKLVSPPQLGSGAAAVARAVTNSRVARFGSKVGGKVAGVGSMLSGGKIIYEGVTGTYDAHTFVDGGMLAVTLTGLGVTAVAVAAGVSAPVWVPIAGAVILIYGVADYLFDANGQLDEAVGRDSKHKQVWRDLGMGREK